MSKTTYTTLYKTCDVSYNYQLIFAPVYLDEQPLNLSDFIIEVLYSMPYTIAYSHELDDFVTWIDPFTGFLFTPSVFYKMVLNLVYILV